MVMNPPTLCKDGKPYTKGYIHSYIDNMQILNASFSILNYLESDVIMRYSLVQKII